MTTTKTPRKAAGSAHVLVVERLTRSGRWVPVESSPSRWRIKVLRGIAESEFPNNKIRYARYTRQP
jgi:hypothetical protein